MEEFNFRKYKVFGWTLYRKTLPAGHGYTAINSAETTHSESDNVTLWTKGRITGVNTATQAPVTTRIPGLFSKNLAAYPAGKFAFKAEEDSEWWCFSYTASRRKEPTSLDAMTLEVGEQHEFPIGSRFLVCGGEVTSPSGTFGPGQAAYVQSAPITVTASQRTFFLLFGSENV
jgi:hypothetical protein